MKGQQYELNVSKWIFDLAKTYLVYQQNLLGYFYLPTQTAPHIHLYEKSTISTDKL